MRRITSPFLAALVAVALQAPSAHAFPPVAGTCIVRIRIDFTDGKMRSVTHSPTTSPSYTMTVTPWLGGLSCAYELNEFPPVGSTSVTAVPDTADDIWTCEEVIGSGTWSQSWTPNPGSSYFDNVYTIGGTWGDWTMLITDADFSSTVHLSLDPFSAVPLPQQCFDAPTGTGAGVDPLNLIGVQVIGGQ